MSFAAFFEPSDWMLSYTISVLIKATVILIATFVVARCLSRNGPALRHAVLLSGLVATAFVPIVVGIMSASNTKTLQLRMIPVDFGLNEIGVTRQQALQTMDLANSQAIAAKANAAVQPSEPDSRIARGEQTPIRATAGQSFQFTPKTIINLLLAAWFSGLVTGFIRLAIGLMRSRWLVSGCHQCDTRQWTDALGEVQHTFGTAVVPRLLVSSRVSTPLVVGVFKPAILLPAGLEDRCSPQQIREILLHEMAHIVRHDILVGWFQRVTAIIWWPHPLVWRLNQRLSQAREEICDNYVLRNSEKHDYAQTLLALSLSASNSSSLASVVGMLEPRWPLEARIRGLLESGRKLNVRVNIGTRVIFLLLAGMGTLFLSGVTARSATEIEVIQDTYRLGGRFEGVSGEFDKSDRLMIWGNWKGTTEDLRNLKEIAGIKDIWFSGVKFDEVVLEDLPDLERISFITNYYDEDLRKQMNVVSLPIKTVRLKNLPKITRFDHRGGGNNLHATQITKLELSEMNRLTELIVEGPQLCDDVLMAVAGAPNLTSVGMTRPISSQSGGRTQITDAGLKELPKLKKLESLDISGARITDNGLATIGALKSLKGLGIAATETTDKGLAHLANLTELTGLGIGETSITDAGLKQIVVNHPKLEGIGLGLSAVTDKGLASLQALKQLKGLGVDVGQITDQSCAILEKLPIRWLNIHGTADRSGRISGLSNLVMAYIDGEANLEVAHGSLKGLKTLYIRGTTRKTVRALFENFRSCEELDYLELSYGWNLLGAVDFERTIPMDDETMQSLSHLRKLKSLTFDGSDHEFGDVGLQALKDLSDLEMIRLPVTRATSDGMAVFADLQKLTRLQIGGEAISNDALVHFRGLKQLKELTFLNTSIERQAVEQLKTELPETNIQLSTYGKP